MTKSNFISLIMVCTFIFFIACKSETPVETTPQVTIAEDLPVTDFDGNVYKTVRIGSQVWMAENLRSTHYSDGTLVQNFCYDNDTSNAAIYGRLYKWRAVMRNSSGSNSNPSGVTGVSPSGWHIPSQAEWQQLIDAIGGNPSAGGKLKSIIPNFWIGSNTEATNESKFNALPAGFFRIDGVFTALGENAVFTTTNYVNSNYIKVVTLQNDRADARIQEYLGLDAVSVRCVKD